MVLLHFGEARAPLYGAFSPGLEPRRRKGVLLLNPWGWEAIRAHRTLQLLADRFSASGVDALRFDYSGSGDSSGDLAGATADAWLRDAELALDELRALASVGKVSLLGLRLGGLLAMELARRRPREVDRLVLWEAPSHGDEFSAWAEVAPRAEARAFPVPAGFREGIRRIDAQAMSEFRGHVLTVSAARPHFPIGRARSVRHLAQPEDELPCWVEDRHHGAGAVPVSLITEVVEWLVDHKGVGSQGS